MKSPLSILHLEDDPVDAALIQDWLTRDSIDCAIRRVGKRSDFIEALKNGNIDLILADYSLPAFNGIEALEIVKAQWPEIPFILVSGVLGEEVAVESLKKGATDYILKDRPSRLVPAVRRAMEEVEMRVEKKYLEEQILRTQKLELFGELAGGLAHDFNNILTVIMSNSSLLMAGTKNKGRLHKFASQIEYASEHAASLTRQLLIFSRHEAQEPVTLALDQLVKNTESMLRHLIPENIDLKSTFTGDNVCVHGDAGCLEQVLINLVMNARDAITGAGSIEIKTGCVSLEEAEVAHSAMAGDYAVLSVRDNGRGMSEEVKSHLFEPFFTTKPAGSGTGLGLVTCQRIIAEAGGHISVESEAGEGTTFTIFLPRTFDRVPPALKTEAEESPEGGTETLLLVEDDPALRSYTGGLLEELGYHVFRASNGKEGLQMMRIPHTSPPKLVVTDVVMPVMDGSTMARALQDLHPGLRFLFLSGYPDRTIAPHGVLTPEIHFLRKPFTPALLAKAVRKALADHPVRIPCLEAA
ncbi:MAG: hybrid sensor histidine kinase/response regulator [Terrimicrobiaceae bacterium]